MNIPITHTVKTISNLSTRLSLALRFHALGWNVIPTNRKKQPATPEWKKWHTQRQTEADVKAMNWQHAYGIGLIHGDISGGLLHVDFDKQLDRHAVDTFLAMCDLPPDYPWQVKTPGGGWHVVLSCPDLALTNETGQAVGQIDRTGILSGHIEIRWNDHYTLAPFSTNEKGKYTLLGDPAQLPSEPPAVVDAITLLGAYSAVTFQPEKPAAPPDDRPYDTSERDYSGFIQVVLDREFDTVASAKEGSRNRTLYNAALKLGGFVKTDLLAEFDVYSTLESAAARSGLLAEDGLEAIRKSIASGLKNADPRRPRTRFKRVSRVASGTGAKSKKQADDSQSLESSPASGAKVTVNLRYISDMDLSLYSPGGAFIVRAMTGAGKTEMINRLIAHLEQKEGRKLRTVVINHRRLLSSNTSKRTDFEDYQNIPHQSRHLLDDLVLCINSLPTLEELPAYDIVFVDEIEQVLSHIFGDTFKGNQGLQALSALEHIVSHARWVIGLDAYAGLASYRWLRSIRNDLTFIENTYQPTPKPLNRFSNESAMLAHIDRELAQADKPILIACASRDKAKTIYKRYLNQGIDPDAIKLLTSEESADPKEQDFIRNINDRLPDYKLLIFSPSMGTGVDIVTPVWAIYGFFSARDKRGFGFTAPDMLQMIGRARNADSYHFELNANPLEEPLPTLPGTIYRAQRERMLNSNRRVEKFFNEAGLKDISQPQTHLLRLHALIEARCNRSKNDLHADFMRLADRQYAITQNDAPAVQAIRDELKDIRAAEKEAEKTRLLTAIPINPDEYAEKSKEATGAELDALKAGLERWHIEDYYKQPLTEEIYDFNEANGQQRLEAFCDLVSPTKAVASEDAIEIRNDNDGHKRKHRGAKRQLIIEAMRAAWGEVRTLGDLNRNPIAHEVIVERIEAFRQANGKLLKLYFKRRSLLSDDPLDLLRWLLKRAGLQLELVRNSKLASEGDFYRVSNGSLSQMEGLAAARLKGLENAILRDSAINIYMSKSRRGRKAA